MADFKRRTLILTSGKQIKLYGNSMAIGSSLEVGEGAAPNILSFMEQHPEEKVDAIPDQPQQNKPVKTQPAPKLAATVLNPHRLTIMEILEMADFNIQLWMQLKDNIRRYGLANPRIFNRDM